MFTAIFHLDPVVGTAITTQLEHLELITLQSMQDLRVETGLLHA